ncbi:MAG: cysteine hydrolase [Candidatus Rokubacteria bacterium]|nr:cysteine hydrolase [Candidatus Rokubacteria bacterium]
MKPPVEFQDRGAYRARMNELLRIDPARTVVLTVDMQRDYLDPEVASAPVALDEAERVMKHARDLLDFARGRGLPIVHVYVNRRRAESERGLETAGETFRVNREHGLSQNAQAGVRRIPDRREGSPQAEVPAILVAPDDVHVTTKKSLDGFLGTDLEFLLSRVYKAETVVLTGINTDTCVYSTAFSASNRGFRTVVISDCVASMRGRDHHWMALELMARSIAWVLTVAEFKAKLGAM